MHTSSSVVYILHKTRKKYVNNSQISLDIATEIWYNSGMSRKEKEYSPTIRCIGRWANMNMVGSLDVQDTHTVVGH